MNRRTAIGLGGTVADGATARSVVRRSTVFDAVAGLSGTGRRFAAPEYRPYNGG